MKSAPDSAQGTTAFFDFDGTLLPQRNSLIWQFVNNLPDERRRTHKKRAFAASLLSNVPRAIAGIVDHDGMYQSMVRSVFGGLPVEMVRATQPAVTEYIESSLFERMRQVLDSHADHTRVMVTANIEPLVKGFCDANGMHCLATRLEEKEGRYTGRIVGELCKAEEKVRRIQECEDFELAGTSTTAFGNTLEDLAMLRFVDAPVLVNPDTKLSRAEGLHWAPKIFTSRTASTATARESRVAVGPGPGATPTLMGS